MFLKLEKKNKKLKNNRKHRFYKRKSFSFRTIKKSPYFKKKKLNKTISKTALQRLS